MSQVRRDDAAGFQKRPAVRLILFDAFETLVTPRIAPYLQYAEQARIHGLHVQDEPLKHAFKRAFKSLSDQHPNYGRDTGLSSPGEWWTLLMIEAFLGAGVKQGDLDNVLPGLASSILKRFESTEAYKLAGDRAEERSNSEIFEALRELHSLRTSDGESLVMALASNSDDRILSVCKELGLSDFLDLDLRSDSGTSPQTLTHSSRGPTMSYDIGYEKPSPQFFSIAVERAFPSPLCSSLSSAQQRQATLYVGDHFAEDYRGALNAGLQALWLRRQQSEPDLHTRPTDLNIASAISMLDVVGYVKRSWHSQ